MGNTKGQLFQFGGVPVDSGGMNNWPGYWGSNVWFVDGDDGGAAANLNRDNSPTNALATVSQAIAAATATPKLGVGDTIYVKPRIPQASASDPEVYAEELTIPYAMNSLSIIGTRRGHDIYYGPKLKLGRSEERRVGREWRTRWGGGQYKKTGRVHEVTILHISMRYT